MLLFAAVHSIQAGGGECILSQSDMHAMEFRLRSSEMNARWKDKHKTDDGDDDSQGQE